MAALQPDFGDLFINPYNFVTKTSHVERQMPQKGTLTGCISCRIIARSPVALPDHRESSDRRFGFYSVAGKPIIPGSEIKGCVRSVFEALTPSCFSVINSNVLTKRLSRPDLDVKPGILRFMDGRWVLFAAEKCKTPPGNGTALKRTWLTLDGKRTNTAWYRQTGSGPVHVCGGEEIGNFTELLDIFAANSRDARHILRVRDQIENREDTVVFYKAEGADLTYFSPAQISRQMFRNTVTSLLGEHAAGICGKDGLYCPACALFGAVGNKNARASRLRFGDAEAQRATVSDEYYNLPELSSPKITSVEFYSRRSGPYRNAPLWDYDSEGVSLNGRKFYYHSRPKREERLGPRSVAVKPALPGSVFRFDLWFDSVDEEQLRRLLWVLTLGDNTEDSRYCHKLGTGKPAGYGSVKIVVDGIRLRSFDPGRYTVTGKTYADFAVTDALFSEREALRDLLRIVDLHYLDGRRVSYPIADNGRGGVNARAAHQWFSGNRIQGNRSRAAAFRYVLHPLSDDAEDLELPAMTAQAGGRGDAFFGSPAPRPRPAGGSAAGPDAPLCKCCGKKPAGINRQTGKPFPLCPTCNNDRVTVPCVGCGRPVATPRYYADRGPRCPDCRKER